MIRKLLLWLIVLALGSPAAAAKSAEKPLFASSDAIHITVAGPMSTLARNRAEMPRPGSLTVAGTNQQLPVTLSTRGITRRAADVCQFPPLKVRFTSPPPLDSVFAGQKSLKLVAYCRNAESFQQYVLLEYAAYRMFNALSPASFRVRLARIDFVNDDGRPFITRYGFFIEDLEDVARRNTMREAKLPELIPITSLSPRHAALYAMFQDMIANHDWSMRAGPKGEECCHNAKMIAPAQGVAAGAIPIPYDFDFSGLVNAPYATPPDELHLSSVRQRQYRGYCIHNGEAYAVAAQMRAARPQMLAALASTPGLEPTTIERATAYLNGFFDQIQSNDTVRSKVLKTCL
jgi:hypothetical protein